MSKTKLARPPRDAGRSRSSPRAHSLAPAAGHSYVALLGIETFDTASLLAQVRQGIAYGSWERFLQSTGLTKEAASRLIQITPRTLARRKEEGRLQPGESDRLLRAARIFSQAVGLFEGDEAAAQRWVTG